VTRISIKNFQSIGNIEFDINGFTVLVGKNNIGKSAVVRAIMFALTNQQGTDFIRKGTKECEVGIVKDAFNLVWKKGSGAVYLINGEKFSKIKGIPQPIINAGFKPVELGDQKVCPLFAEQFEPNFLLNQTGSKVAEALSAMYKLDLITLADELCQKELRSAKNLLKTREEDLVIVDKQLEKFKGFEAIKKQHQEIRSLEKRCEELRKEIDVVQSFESRLKEIATEIKRLEPLKKIEVPDSKTCNQKLVRFQEIQRFYTEFVRLQESTQELTTVTSIDVPSHTEADKHLKDLETITKWLTNYETLLHSVSGLKKFAELEIPQHARADKIMKEVAFLTDFERAFQESVASTRETRNELGKMEEQLKGLNEERSKITACPLCKRAF